MVTEEEVKKLAQHIWEAEGRAEGRASDHYFRAKRMLEEKEIAALNRSKIVYMLRELHPL